jgi:hypothetical protein
MAPLPALRDDVGVVDGDHLLGIADEFVRPASEASAKRRDLHASLLKRTIGEKKRHADLQLKS